jgi:hypothetical protein
VGKHDAPTGDLNKNVIIPNNHKMTMMSSCVCVEISGLDLACTPNVYFLDIIPEWWSNNLDGRCVMFQNPRSVIIRRRLQGSKLYTDMFQFMHA